MLQNIKEDGKFKPTIKIFFKTKELHHCVYGHFLGIWVSYTGVAGAGKHVAFVLPPGVYTGVLYLQEQASLDAVQYAVGVFNLGHKGIWSEQPITFVPIDDRAFFNRCQRKPFL